MNILIIDQDRESPADLVHVLLALETTTSTPSWLRPNIIFFVFWSKKVPRAITDNYTCVGFHCTDLPFGRGGHPIQNLLLRGFTETTITAFKLTDEMDAGPWYMKRRHVPLRGNLESIRERFAHIIYIEMIPYLIKDSLWNPVPQEGEVSRFHRLTGEQLKEVRYLP